MWIKKVKFFLPVYSLLWIVVNGRNIYFFLNLLTFFTNLIISKVKNSKLQVTELCLSSCSLTKSLHQHKSRVCQVNLSADRANHMTTVTSMCDHMTDHMTRHVIVWVYTTASPTNTIDWDNMRVSASFAANNPRLYTTVLAFTTLDCSCWYMRLRYLRSVAI